MDSCHLFNFLFGPRKATSELSKCLSALGRKDSNNNNDGTKASGQTKSPLKQLQVKLASYTGKTATQTSATTATTNTSTPSSTSSGNKSNNKDKQQTNTNQNMEAKFNRKSGIYEAILVKSSSFDEDDHVHEHNFDINVDDNEDDNICNYINYQDLDDNNNCVHQKINNNINKIYNSNRQTKTTCIDFDSIQSSYVDSDQINSLDSTSSVTTRQPESIESGGVHWAPQNGQPALVMYGNESDDSLTGGGSASGYSDCGRGQRDRQQLVSYAEVYNLVSAGPESNMKLVKVSTFPNLSADINNNNNTAMGGEAIQRLDDNDRGQTEAGEVQRRKASYVKRMVQSFESNQSFDDTLDCSSSTWNELTETDNSASLAAMQSAAAPDANHHNNNHKPIKLVRPLAPPEPAPKSLRARYIQAQLKLNKPAKLSQLFADTSFLERFFRYLDPLDRCQAAMVCSQWRQILYSKQQYWKDISLVIDYSQLRREHLVERIISTLQSAARMKSQRNGASNNNDSHGHSKQQTTTITSLSASVSASDALEERHSSISADSQLGESTRNTESLGDLKRTSIDSNSLCMSDLDQDDVWRIQEICNRQANRGNYLYTRGHLSHQTVDTSQDMQQQQQAHDQDNNNKQQQADKQRHTSQSSSIPSQISSTFSSVSLSSMLMNPVHEPSRIEVIRDKLYASIDARGIDALCISGATNEDIEDLIAKLSNKSKLAIVAIKLINAFVHDKAIWQLTETFSNSRYFELSGCNEISNFLEFSPQANKIEHLVINDCIHVGDNVGKNLLPLMANLHTLTIQAYHLTDSFLDIIAVECSKSLCNLRRLELPSCKEISNKSIVIIARHLTQLEGLSLSYSKITDDGVEILASRAKHLEFLDLSWCSLLTDSALEALAANLANNLEELVLDRVLQITDCGLMQLAKIRGLKLLDIRWCHQITDLGLEFILSNLKHLKYLSIAGLDQITNRSLLALPMTQLLEVELTNCSAVDEDLRVFLSNKMPNCNIVY